jgi:hypothetical protein
VNGRAQARDAAADDHEVGGPLHQVLF